MQKYKSCNLYISTKNIKRHLFAISPLAPIVENMENPQKKALCCRNGVACCRENLASTLQRASRLKLGLLTPRARLRLTSSLWELRLARGGELWSEERNLPLRAAETMARAKNTFAGFFSDKRNIACHCRNEI